ncbi:MAG TPA: serpin family protein [Terracidiphilus sp.]|nr:serpin family protein [Terracidiphilus sp.]
MRSIYGCVVMAVLMLLILSSSSSGWAARAQARECPLMEVKTGSGGERTAVKGNGSFALNLFAEIRSQGKGFLMSSDGISTAWSMAFGGAHDKRGPESAESVHFSLSPRQLYPTIVKLFAGTSEQSRAERHLGNLWMRQNQNFVAACLKLAEAHAAGFRPVRFQFSREPAHTSVDTWGEPSNENLPNLFPAGAIDDGQTSF